MKIVEMTKKKVFIYIIWIVENYLSTCMAKK